MPPPTLPALARAAEQTDGLERLQVLALLRARAQHNEDEELLETIYQTSVREVARGLGITRQAVQHRARHARRRLSGGS